MDVVEAARRSWVAGVGCLVCLSATPAVADFDPALGKVVLDDYPVRLSFDAVDAPAALGESIYLSAQWSSLTPPANTIARDAARVLEGQGALRLGRMAWGLVIGLDRAASQLQGRAVRVSLWVRPEGAMVSADLLFARRPLVGAGAAELFDVPGAVRLLPTGRATDDGWRELSSGVVDFSQLGGMQAQALRILDTRMLESLFFGLESNPDGEVWLDALSIEVVSAQRVAPLACRLTTEAERCGADGACLMGRCVDAKLVVDNRPEDPEVRRAYLERLGFRAQLLAGGRYTQARTDAFRARLGEVAGLPSAAAAAAVYRRAFDDLGDGHVSPPLTRLDSPPPPALCMYMGEADLLPQGGLRPLVLELDPTGPAAARLQVGDALVAIDGLAPEAWMERAGRLLSYTGDPRGRPFVLAPELWQAGLRSGARLTFERCARREGCGPDEVVRVELDLAELGAAFWDGRPLELGSGDLVCDFRFRRDVRGPLVRQDDFAGHADVGSVRSILINAVPGYGAWRGNVEAALRDLPPRVLLDQRTGFGGTFEGVSLLLAPFLAPDEAPWVHLVPQLQPEASVAELDDLVACQAREQGFCANFYALPLVSGGGPSAGASEAWLAIVNGFDVSGNDYLPKALTQRRGGRTRVFGAVPTFGAFGPIYGLPRLMDELYGGSGQLHDTAFVPDEGSRSLSFNTGYGVEPDEVVLQRQSDALLGVDTVLEAARAWLTAARAP